MKICVSLNGVTADTPTAFVSLIERDLGMKVPTHTFSKGLVGGAYPNAVPGGKIKRLLIAGWEAVKRRVFDTDEFRRVPPVRGAVAAYEALTAAGHKIRIVTDAKSLSRRRLELWLHERKFPTGIDIIFTRKGRRSKRPYQQDCEVVIDHDLERLSRLVDQPGLRLIHFVPEKGTTGANAAVLSTDSRIPSLRGWDAVLSALLPQDQGALAA